MGQAIDWSTDLQYKVSQLNSFHWILLMDCLISQSVFPSHFMVLPCSRRSAHTGWRVQHCSRAVQRGRCQLTSFWWNTLWYQSKLRHKENFAFEEVTEISVPGRCVYHWSCHHSFHHGCHWRCHCSYHWRCHHSCNQGCYWMDECCTDLMRWEAEELRRADVKLDHQSRQCTVKQPRAWSTIGLD